MGFLSLSISKLTKLAAVTVTMLFLVSLSSKLPQIMAPQPKYGIVQLFSENHVCEAMHSCRTYTNVTEIKNGNITFIGLYAPDVKPEHLAMYREACPFVQLRQFSVSAYPEYVKNFTNYRFKYPTVVSVLPEFSTILYVDASIKFISRDSNTMIDLFKSMENEFAQQGVRLFSKTAHRNFPVTHPHMYDFFNVTVDQMKSTTQLQSCLYMLNNSPAGWNIINKLVQCAMEPKCMAPEGSKQRCDPAFLYQNERVICHRFDQSALNMRLMELYGTNESVYYRPTPLLKDIRENFCRLK